jgi:hypothetical protein
VLAFAAYSALAVVVTFPLVLHLPDRLPKDLGDPLITAAILWWNAHVMPLTDRWWNGFGFFPATGMLAFSSHFLGASLIAAPLQWAGCGAITAYNVTLLLSFPLCGISAYALGLTLTKRHDAAAICGLAYGFNPYRVAHIEHLELLLAFGMPAALAALHQYAETRRTAWLAAFGAALIVQALSCSYYALFFTVVVAMWVAWFMRPAAWRQTLAMAAAGAVSVVLVSPVVLGYARIHHAYNLTRDFTDEVLKFSGDLTSLVTASPLSALWGWTSFLNEGERQLFPGLTITALAVTGAILLCRSRTVRSERWAVVSAGLWMMAAAFAAIAIAARLIGPWQIEWGWIRVSVTASFKPASLAVACAAAGAASSTTFRNAFRERSALAFYLIAAVVLFICSLGPQPTLLGERILYEPPYAWLMRLPFFADTVRVPARFAMPAILALSAGGSLAFHALATRPRHRLALALVVMTGLIADGLVRGLPLPAAPQHAFRIATQDPPVAILELPLGDVWRDTAALYRATLEGAPSVNGYNGYEPPYYQALRRALGERDQTALDALARFGPILIAADQLADRAAPWAAFVSKHAGVTPARIDGNWALFRLAATRPAAPRAGCASNPVAIATAADNHGPLDLTALTDDDTATRWATPGGQRAGDALTLGLSRAQGICEVVLSMGATAVLYPGALSAATSMDGVTWQTVYAGMMGGSAIRAALDDPRDARISVPLQGRAARFVRLRIEAPQARYPWAVAGVAVEGAAAALAAR